MAISTNGVMLTRLTGALYNQQLSASTYSEILAGNTTAASLNAWANAAVAADFGTKTDLQVARSKHESLVTRFFHWLSPFQD